MRTIKCCSVVFGVTLWILVINTSSSSPVKNKQRRLPATVTNLPPFGTAVIALGSRTTQHAMESDIVRESRFLPTPPAVNACMGGSPSEYFHKFDIEKNYGVATRWWKILKICSLVSTEYMNVMDGRTDGHIRATAQAAFMQSIARQKNPHLLVILLTLFTDR